jgi:enoyl-CoA hydratase
MPQPTDSPDLPRYVRYTTDEHGVATVTIADPNDARFVGERHPMHRELRDVWGRLDADTSVRAVVLVGGSHDFCPAPALPALRDLLGADPAAPERLQEEARDIVVNMLRLSKPLVAAVGAPASGVGAQLALAADFLVMAVGTTLQDSHVRIGLAAGDGATLLWPLAVGLPTARRHIFTGAPLAAEDAHRLGAVHELASDPASAVAAATALAATLTRSDAQAFAASKKALNGWLDAVRPIVLDEVNRIQVDSYRGSGFAAFLDRFAGSADAR